MQVSSHIANTTIIPEGNICVSRHPQLAVWQLLAGSLHQGIPVMLLYVLESNGSSPGRQGFAMAVNQQGDMAGSIGGGIMEHKFVEMAKDKLSQPVVKSSGTIRRQVHDKAVAKDQSGMICSGDQTIWMYPLALPDLGVVDHCVQALTANSNGSLRLSNGGIEFLKHVPTIDYSFQLSNASDWQYTEKLGYKNHLHIIGGGHCALALSRMMSNMDFLIRVYDERAGLHTMNQNIFAHQKVEVPTYDQLGEIIESGSNHYVVVMTFGYRTDDAAIRSLLGKSFAYFGVMGSAKKIAKLFSDYIAEGISSASLDKIEAPVGLQINSKTPDEIAVSIAASIIKIKNGA